MSGLSKKKIVVTGGAGFLGKVVLRELEKKKCSQIFVPLEKDFDLTRTRNITRLLKKTSPDIVIHLAALVGGIGANRENPGKFFYNNLIMGVELMEQARLSGVENLLRSGRFVLIPNLPKCLLKKRTSGWDILRKQMPRMA